eukprot:6183912-Pleurochrysis_carterae.AAC.2
MIPAETLSPPVSAALFSAEIELEASSNCVELISAAATSAAHDVVSAPSRTRRAERARAGSDGTCTGLKFMSG